MIVSRYSEQRPLSVQRDIEITARPEFSRLEWDRMQETQWLNVQRSHVDTAFVCVPPKVEWDVALRSEHYMREEAERPLTLQVVRGTASIELPVADLIALGAIDEQQQGTVDDEDAWASTELQEGDEVSLAPTSRHVVSSTSADGKRVVVAYTFNTRTTKQSFASMIGAD